MREQSPILVVDDEPDIRRSLGDMLQAEGFSVQGAQSGRQALARLRGPLRFSLAIVDLRLPDLSGIELLEKFKEQEPELPVILLTAYGEVSSAVLAMQKGAFHYLCKPFSNAELLHWIRRALENRKRDREIEVLREQLHGRLKRPNYIFGKSGAMQEVLKRLGKVSPTDMTVLLQGESGVGKEAIAHTIHQKSRRHGKPFIALDCGTLPEELVESELFGYEKGAFTGADTRKLGQFELAHEGTLFLDEIGNLKPSTQAKLLRVIQERCVRHLGGKKDIAVDVRLIAATNRVLNEEVQKGHFREDLYHRVNEFTLTVAPLRERREDIPSLAELFLEEVKVSLHKISLSISPQALRILKEAPWPGNIRQLRNVLRASALMADDILKPEHIRPLLGNEKRHPATREPKNVLKKALQQTERETILEMLKKTGGNKAKAARLLEIDRSLLYDKLKRLQISSLP